MRRLDIPLKGFHRFQKRFINHRLVFQPRFATDVRSAERTRQPSPPLEKVFVLMSGEKEGYGGNRVGESRAVRSLNSLQPLVRALPRHSPPLSLVEGQSINILMGLNCRFYPSNDGGSSSIRSAEPPIASLYLFSPSFAHPASAPFRQISRIRKNVKKKKKKRKNRIYEAFSFTARTLKSRSIHPIFFGKNELPGKILPLVEHRLHF